MIHGEHMFVARDKLASSRDISVRSYPDQIMTMKLERLTWNEACLGHQLKDSDEGIDPKLHRN